MPTKGKQTPPSAVRCAIYARISPKPEGAVGDNYSIASQIHALREYARANHGCADPVEFVDKDISGATLDRPALDRLRDGVAARAFDVVAAYSPDRLSREMVDAVILRGEVTKSGAALEFVSGSYEDTPEGEFAFSVQSLVSQYERRKFAERSRRGRQQRARDGYVHTSDAPYGYRYLGKKDGSRGTYEIQLEEAAIVRRIYAETTAGKTLYQVALGLNNDGIAPPRGRGNTSAAQREERGAKGIWHREVVGRLIRKTAYRGVRLEAGGVEVRVPEIVSKAEWDAAHLARSRNAEARSGRPSRKYLLTSYLWCVCGKRCRTSSGIYHCGRFAEGVCRKRTCPQKGRASKTLDQFVWDAIWETLSSPKLLLQMVEAYRKEFAQAPAKGDDMSRRIDRLRRAVARAEEMLYDPDVVVATAKERLAAARKELQLLEAQRPAPVVEMPAKSVIQALSREFAQCRNLEEFAHRRGIVERVVNQIVYGDGEVKIHCKIALQNCDRHQQVDHSSTPSIAFVLTRRVA